MHRSLFGNDVGAEKKSFEKQQKKIKICQLEEISFLIDKTTKPSPNWKAKKMKEIIEFWILFLFILLWDYWESLNLRESLTSALKAF